MLGVKFKGRRVGSPGCRGRSGGTDVGFHLKGSLELIEEPVKRKQVEGCPAGCVE